MRLVDDVHGNSYTLRLQPYVGLDFSKKCFVFPGQSAAVPEMGRDDYARHELIQKRFAVADALAAQLGVTAPSLYIESSGRVPVEEISAVQCLALFTMSVALFELLLVILRLGR
jgi:acyl transferase domain-containing protein